MSTETDIVTNSPVGKVADEERFQTSGVSTIAAAHALHDTYTAFLAPMLPELIAKYGLSTTQAGALSVFQQWPSLLQPFIGYLADHLTLRYFVILAPAITATMMSSLGLAPSYTVMIMFLMVAGFSSAGLHATAPVMAGHLSGRNLGRGMGFWMLGGEVGRTLGPLIIVAAISVLGLDGTGWLMIGGWLASVVLYIRLKDVPGRPPNGNAARPWRLALRAMRPLLIPVAGIALVRAFISVALSTYLPTFMASEGASLWLAGASLSVLEAAGVIGALVGGSLSDRLGRRLVLATSMLLTPVFMFAFLGLKGWVEMPLLMLLGFTTLSISPVMMALVQESFPENRALANGIYMALSFVLRALAVLTVGLLGDNVGLRVAFTFTAAAPLLGLPFVWFLPKSDGRVQEEPA